MRQQPRSHRTRAAIVALALATALAITAAPASADVGSVYFDNLDNAAAGQSFFKAGFTGGSNVGLARQVMLSLTTGDGTPPSATPPSSPTRLATTTWPQGSTR